MYPFWEVKRIQYAKEVIMLTLQSLCLTDVTVENRFLTFGKRWKGEQKLK